MNCKTRYIPHSLWCEGLTKISMEENTGCMDSGDEMPGPVSSPRRKRSVIDERHACVQTTFDELKEQHKNKYILWATIQAMG